VIKLGIRKERRKEGKKERRKDPQLGKSVGMD